MNNKLFWKKVGIVFAGTLGGVYIIFLALPLLLNPIIETYTPQIKNIIHESIGLESSLENVRVVTTPKFTAGLKVGKFALFEPDNSEILSADNFQVKMSLLPILGGKIRIDVVQLDNAKVNLLINKDGKFEIEKYFTTDENSTAVNSSSEDTKVSTLPLGFRLSNHLPDIRVGNYDITLTDGVDKYTLSGKRTEITDFILNKSIKVKAEGKAVLKDREQFNYNLKVLNKIMPEVELNDLVFNPVPREEQSQEFAMPDIIGILKGIYTNNLTADADVDLIIANEGINGKIYVTNISLLNLPASSINLKFKNNRIDILSNIYTAKNEVSKIDGVIKNGKHPNIDLNIKSRVELSNILRIVKEIALIFDVKDLQTLSANGKLDANFKIKSDLKTVKSSGYLNIPSADVYYGLYKIGIDNINADVIMDNNNVNIKNIGFSVLNQPLKLYGTVSNDAVSDLHLTATDLSLKGLLVAAGQAALMKENQINSGSVSMKADIQGNLDKINPVINLVLNNINISNLPSNTKLIAPSTTVSINGIALSGEAKSSNVSVINPCAKVSLPSLTAQIQEKEIVIPQTSVKIEDINVNVSGKIKNYLTENIGLEFVTTGDIKSALAGDINLVKQILNLNYSTTDSSTIIIPMFDKSKMSFTGNLGITGSMLNPMLKGNISIPTLSIPEIPVSMTNLDIKLNGNILNGTGSVQKFVSGGIEAENLTSDFSLKGENFYLKNLKGTAFDGKISGNIIYNIINAKTHVTFLGTGLNAEKAVAGAVGIKNALSGILGFDTDLTLIAADYNDMMKSLNGKLKFDVKNGAFGSIGRMDKFLHANNIMTNAVLKTTVSTLTSGTTLADTAKFEYIEGNLDFANGWANINPVKSSGKSLSYYVTGKYNLINGTANVSILGRLDSQIIAKLGIIGQLSADKLLSYIPIFGTTTANIVKALTSDPKSENISAIPALSSGTASYKDFKVVFNGGLESTSSVKSFKWLTDVDMTAIETKTVKESITDIKKSVTQDYKNTVQGVKDTITNSKEQWQATKDDFYATKDQIKNSADEIINLFKKKSPAEK